ncbi:MAG: hypothetical protein SNJ64_06060 [Endomicrobiia bacterium]
MLQPLDKYIKILTATMEYSSKGQIAKTKTGFFYIFSSTIENPFLTWNTGYEFLTGKAFLMMYIFDIFRDEKKNIQIAHFSYLYLNKALNDYNHLSSQKIETENDFTKFELLKNIIILFHVAGECFKTTIETFFKRKNPLQDAGINKELSQMMISYILSDTLFKLMDIFPDLQDEPYLLDISKDITINNLQPNDKIKNVITQVKIDLYDSIFTKINNKNFSF